jgi:hypothetical protein
VETDRPLAQRLSCGLIPLPFRHYRNPHI